MLILIKVHFRSVLIKARRDLVFGLFDAHAVDMVDALANIVIGIGIRRAREGVVVG